MKKITSMEADEISLDENNGRFCVTPEFPNGTYAYFATFDPTPSSDGVFKNYKKPAFPYLIGKSYNSKPSEFNTKKSSNQNEFDLNKFLYETLYYKSTSFITMINCIKKSTILKQNKMVYDLIKNSFNTWLKAILTFSL